jgi:4-hydroxy-3-methylbut-2-en-1-yl diphosphate synthase IspG/GcpE
MVVAQHALDAALRSPLHSGAQEAGMSQQAVIGHINGRIWSDSDSQEITVP